MRDIKKPGPWDIAGTSAAPQPERPQHGAAMQRRTAADFGLSERAQKYIDAAHAVTDPAATSLHAIFSARHPFGSAVHDIEDLHSLIEAGHVTRRTVELPWVDPARLSPEVRAYVERTFSGQTAQHKELCYVATLWLDDLGASWSVEDLGYAGGCRADVLSRERDIAIECGYTSARKIMQAVREGTEVVVIPYPGEAGLAHPAGFAFKATASLPKRDPWANPAGARIRVLPTKGKP